jgi:hypothetical protein
MRTISIRLIAAGMLAVMALAGAAAAQTPASSMLNTQEVGKLVSCTEPAGPAERHSTW